MQKIKVWTYLKIVSKNKINTYQVSLTYVNSKLSINKQTSYILSLIFNN